MLQLVLYSAIAALVVYPVRSQDRHVLLQVGWETIWNAVLIVGDSFIERIDSVTMRLLSPEQASLAPRAIDQQQNLSLSCSSVANAASRCECQDLGRFE